MGTTRGKFRLKVKFKVLSLLKSHDIEHGFVHPLPSGVEKISVLMVIESTCHEIINIFHIS